MIRASAWLLAGVVLVSCGLSSFAVAKDQPKTDKAKTAVDKEKAKAEKEKAKAAKEKAKAEKEKTATGKVKSVDASKNKLALEGKKGKDGTAGEDKQYKIAADCKVTLDGVKKSLSDVEVGKPVKLTLAASGEVSEIAMKAPKKKETK